MMWKFVSVAKLLHQHIMRSIKSATLRFYSVRICIYIYIYIRDMFANNNYLTKNERHVLMGSYFFTHLLFIGF